MIKKAVKRKVSVKKVAVKKITKIIVPSLSEEEVFAQCPKDFFPFASTKDIRESNEIIAQKPAVRAIDMGLGIRKPGYNIYVAGIPGTGKTSVMRTFLEKWSKNSETPKDWIYLYDFQNPENPKAIELEAGEGFRFFKALEQSIKDLRREIPKALQSEDYENAVNAYLSQSSDKQSRKFSELEKTAKKMNFHIKSTRMGIETIPILDGRSLTEKEYSKLNDDQKDQIETRRANLEPRVLEFARNVRNLEIEAKDFINSLQREIVSLVIQKILEPVEENFAKIDAITSYLLQVKENILENILDFIEQDEIHHPHGHQDEEYHLPISEFRDSFRKYKVNLFIDNRHTKGAPVLIESNPTYYNLFGKVEKNIENGMYLTDFTMIKAGSIHKANGGYLVIDANDIFKNPTVWDTLKRVLRNRKGFIEDMGEQFSLLPTSALRPEPIPLDLKVILIGTDEIYHTLHELDDEFSKIFKIKADFDFKMPRTKHNLQHYASFIATRCHKEELMHFDRSGLAAVAEYGSRLVEDQRYLSTQFSEIKDLTIEADFIAQEKNSHLIRREHVEEALAQKFYRVNLIERHLMEMIEAKDIILSLEGARIGQVNGLSVYDMGDYSFGKIVRITCTTSTNEDGIFNIDRASKLSGNIHDKGVYILTGFLNALLAREHSLAFSASVCFEQSYSIIDGDSATCAELTAIVSAMAGIPIKQNCAMTGSLNQLGDVQPVGGINEKVEGFYKTARLLTKGKDFSVIIPHQNVNNLMLNEETRTAIGKGWLKIYPVKNFWEAFELTTGVPFGAKSVQDTLFHANSALGMIQDRVAKIYSKNTPKKEEEPKKALVLQKDAAKSRR